MPSAARSGSLALVPAVVTAYTGPAPGVAGWITNVTTPPAGLATLNSVAVDTPVVASDGEIAVGGTGSVSVVESPEACPVLQPMLVLEEAGSFDIATANAVREAPVKNGATTMSVSESPAGLPELKPNDANSSWCVTRSRACRV